MSATGPDVTIPNNRNVTPTVGGRAITAATPAVATGLAAGFNALGLPYVWGGGGDYNSWLRSARSRGRRSPSS